MRSFFEQTSDVIFEKNTSFMNDVDDYNAYNPYMTTRYASFVDPSFAVMMDMTVNRYGSILKKEEHAAMICACLPLVKKRFINYIKPKDKKTLTPAQEEEARLSAEQLKKFADSHEISVREVQEYMTTLNKDKL